MPIYEYQCAACGRVVEKWQKISETPLTACPTCGGGLHKLISSCAFHLKGSGWYVTDYSGSQANSAAGDKPEAATEAGGGDAAPTTPESDATGSSSPPKIK